MQYKVPQNIDQEDKILGPLTFIQFIYVLIGGAIVILSLALFDTALFLLVAIPTIVLTACFALIKVQDQPFSRFFMAFFVYLLQPKRRVWKDAEAEALAHQQAIAAAEAAEAAKKQAKKKAKDIAPAMNTKTQPAVVKATPRRTLDTIGISRASSVTPPAKTLPTNQNAAPVAPAAQPTAPVTKQPTMITVQGGR